MAALVDVVPRGRLGRAIGWLTLAFQVGFLIGPAAAGMSLQWVSLQVTLAASTALFAAALVTTLAGIPATPRVETAWKLLEPLREMARRRAFAVGTVGLLGATLVWGTLQAYLPLFDKEQLRLPEAQIGYMIAIQAVANGLARIPGGRLVDRLPTRGPLIVLGLGAYAASIALLPHLTGFWSPTALLALSVPALAVVYLALGVVFSSLSTEETRGVAMGVYGMVLYLGLGFGPAVFGAVMDHAGYLAGFTACAATGLGMAALTGVLRSQRLRWPAPAH
jgi:MFS family permease